MEDVKEPLDDWERAASCLRSGDRDAALFLFRGLAKKGDKFAYSEIARLLELGLGSIDDAIMWYERAFKELNDEYAIFSLGRIFLVGHRVPVDYKKAFKYFYLLKDTNQLGAVFLLGRMSEKGWGTEKSLENALHYYERAARAGHLLALTGLGVINLKRLNILFALRCLVRSQIEYTKVRSRNRRDWRINVAMLKPDEQDKVVHKLSLFD